MEDYMNGIIYGVGVGPGDPELMTLKAVRLIRENDIIALPGKEPRETAAYKIALGAVPELAEKTLLAIDMPMTKDKEVQRRAHEEGALLMESYAAEGKNVVYLTLGDSTVYCTFAYLQEIIEQDGYKVELVSGIPSFCAAAARLGIHLSLWNEPLHIIPALHKLDEGYEMEGNYVLMKSGSKMHEVKEQLRINGREAQMVENCGMENERIYRSLEEIPDDAGYFSLIISKEGQSKE